jgi:aspartyl-tRNA(Asn)/glutamyl-tRNA(Gln) amidotransferase subunit A
MGKNTDISSMTAVQLASAIRAKQLSPVEVVNASIERMEKLEPDIHAFCTPTIEIARKQASEVEASINRGDKLGPLAGVPIGIKDLICTKGIRTVSGSAAYEDFIPDEDDIVVERVRKAGAIILGKTNVPEFGYSGASHNGVFETTRNPWDIKLTSGGSSAGSAAAVATGMCAFALGSDGGGSVRIPSSLCGVYGIKPSMGRVPLYPGCRDERFPGVSGWESLEHIGPISRTVKDAALLLSVIAGPDDRDRHSLPEADFDWVAATEGDIQGCRVAFCPDWGGRVAVDPEVRRVTEEAAQLFETKLGCKVEIDDPKFENDPTEVNWTLAWLESDLVGLRKLADIYGDRMTPHVLANIRKHWTAEEFNQAIIGRKEIVNKMWRFMRRYDFLITPTLAVPAFAVHMQGPEKIDGRLVSANHWLSFLAPFNLTGQPAASVPAGFTKSGLPVGLQIIGPHLGDRAVLRASAAFEKAQPWDKTWPQIVSDLA